MMATILLVDDDPPFCAYFVKIAEGLSLHVDQARSIEEAKRLFEKTTYAGAVIDNQLPDGEGLDLVSWLRRREEGKNMPLALVTGHKVESTVFQRLLKELKIDQIYEKPLQQKDIASICQCFTKKEVVPPPQKEGDLEDDAFLDELKKEYDTSIPEKLATIERLIQAIQKDFSLENVDALKKNVHKLAGSAGSYGYAEVSRHCKKLETQLIEDMKNIEGFRNDKEWLNALWFFFNSLKVDFEQKMMPHSYVKSKQSGAFIDGSAQVEVFVVDDDQDLTALMQQVGKAQGFAIDVAHTIDEGMQRLKDVNYNPPVILIDKHFEGEQRSGYDLIAAFRDAHGHDYRSILGIFTGEGRIDQRMHALGLGVELFFQKPIELEDLFAHLREILSVKQIESIRVIHFDDDIDFCKFVKETLNKIHIGVTSFTDGTDFFQRIDETHPDLILLDIEMPEVTGLSLLQVMRADYRYRGIPVMLVTSREDQESMAQGYALQVDDYIQKPVTQEMLQIRVMNYLKKKSQESAQIDRHPVTNFYTTRALFDLFHTLTPQHHHLCLVLMELQIEGQLPEFLLKEFAQFLAKHFRSQDVIGNLTDTQFLVLFPDFRAQQMDFLLRRFFSELQDQAFMRAHLHFTLCAGMVTYPEHGEVLRELIHLARQELEKAKQQGPWHISHASGEEGYALVKARKAKVLLVDDDDDIIKMMQYAFEMRGYEVVALREGMPCLDYLKGHLLNEPPDLIVLDCNLPDISGMIILDHIKEMVGDTIPILMLSSLSQEENVLEALKKGVQDYVTKPFSMSILLEKTLKLLAG